jgi:hypothetical protein
MLRNVSSGHLSILLGCTLLASPTCACESNLDIDSFQQPIPSSSLGPLSKFATTLLKLPSDEEVEAYLYQCAKNIRQYVEKLFDLENDLQKIKRSLQTAQAEDSQVTLKEQEMFFSLFAIDLPAPKPQTNKPLTPEEQKEYKRLQDINDKAQTIAILLDQIKVTLL